MGRLKVEREGGEPTINKRQAPKHGRQNRGPWSETVASLSDIHNHITRPCTVQHYGLVIAL